MRNPRQICKRHKKVTTLFHLFVHLRDIVLLQRIEYEVYKEYMCLHHGSCIYGVPCKYSRRTTKARLGPGNGKHALNTAIATNIPRFLFSQLLLLSLVRRVDSTPSEGFSPQVFSHAYPCLAHGNCRSGLWQQAWALEQPYKCNWSSDLNRLLSVPCGWLSKIMVPVWIPNIIRHLIFRVP